MELNHFNEWDLGPPKADPPVAQWNLRQACNDINMQDWVPVNTGSPYLHPQRQSMSGNQLGQQGGQFGLTNVGVNMKEVEIVAQELSWVVEFKMTGLVKKSSNR